MASLSAEGPGASLDPPAEKASLLRLIDWIWHIRGEVALPVGTSADGVFDRLDPLFAHPGTIQARSGELVRVSKKNQLAQDPLSIVDSGTLRIEPAGDGALLRYHLVSRALLYCFLAPLMFLAIGQLTVALGKLEKPAAEDKAAKDKAKDKDKKAELQLNPVDKFLGAPAPENPKDDKKDAKDKKKDGDDEKDGFSPTPAYVFAGIFAALWLLGRLLEPWLIKRLFKRHLVD